jgi:hypothetical protein
MSSENLDATSDSENGEITASLLKLFAPPPPSSSMTITQSEETTTEQSHANQTAPSVSDGGEEDLRRTFVVSNRVKHDSAAATAAAKSGESTASSNDNFGHETTFSSLFEPSPPTNAYETTPLLSSSFGNDTVTPKVTTGQRKSSLTKGSQALSVGLTPVRLANTSELPFQSMYSKPLPPIEEASDKKQLSSLVLPSMNFIRSEIRKIARVIVLEMASPSTWIGGTDEVEMVCKGLSQHVDSHSAFPRSFHVSFVSYCILFDHGIRNCWNTSLHVGTFYQTSRPWYFRWRTSVLGRLER